MITPSTYLVLPGLVSPTREPWEGTLDRAMTYDGDRIDGRAHALAEHLEPEGEDEDRELSDCLAVIARHMSDQDAVRDIFDDPNATIRTPIN